MFPQTSSMSRRFRFSRIRTSKTADLWRGRHMRPRRKAPAAPARMLLFARALRIWGSHFRRWRSPSRARASAFFFRFEAFSCWNFIEFMSNLCGAGPQKPLSGIIQKLMCCRTRQKRRRACSNDVSTSRWITAPDAVSTHDKEGSYRLWHRIPLEYQPNGKEIAVIKPQRRIP